MAERHIRHVCLNKNNPNGRSHILHIYLIVFILKKLASANLSSHTHNQKSALIPINDTTLMSYTIYNQGSNSDAIYASPSFVTIMDSFYIIVLSL